MDTGSANLWKRTSFVQGFRRILQPSVKVSDPLSSKVGFISVGYTTNSALHVLLANLRSKVIWDIIIFKDLWSFLRSCII